MGAQMRSLTVKDSLDPVFNLHATFDVHEVRNASLFFTHFPIRTAAADW
jgi:hypothetical protein